MTKGLLAGVLVNESDAVRAESLCAELTAAIFGGAFGWDVCHLVRGEQEQCAAAIGNAVRERDSRVPFLLPFVRTGPAWPEIATMMNLPSS
jgi:hypothetical protein